MNLFKNRHQSSQLVNKSSQFTPRIMQQVQTEMSNQELFEIQNSDIDYRTPAGINLFNKTDFLNIIQL